MASWAVHLGPRRVFGETRGNAKNCGEWRRALKTTKLMGQKRARTSWRPLGDPPAYPRLRRYCTATTLQPIKDGVHAKPPERRRIGLHLHTERIAGHQHQRYSRARGRPLKQRPSLTPTPGVAVHQPRRWRCRPAARAVQPVEMPMPDPLAESGDADRRRSLDPAMPAREWGG